MHKNFPLPEEYHPFYDNYIIKLQGYSLKKALKYKEKVIKRVLRSITKQKWDFAYKADKWTVRDVIQHMVDTERIFIYRGLHILREDPNPIFSFDESQYAINSHSIIRSQKSLTKEYIHVTQSTYYFFENLEENQLKKHNIYNDKKLTVRSLGYIICGHALHHAQILKERYLTQQ